MHKLLCKYVYVVQPLKCGWLTHSASRHYFCGENSTQWTFSIARYILIPQSPLLYRRLVYSFCFTIPTFPKPILPQLTSVLGSPMRLTISKFMVSFFLSLAYFISLITSIFNQCHKWQRLLFIGGMVSHVYIYHILFIRPLMSSCPLHIWIIMNSAAVNMEYRCSSAYWLYFLWIIWKISFSFRGPCIVLLQCLY